MLYVMLHLGDWSNWTRLYSLLERGVLIELITMYFSTESAINPSLFERITRRYTEEELKAFDFVIEDFFYLGDDGLYHNDACDQIIAKSKEKSEKARKSIQARWSKKTDEQRSKYERNTDEVLTNNQEPITNKDININKPASISAENGGDSNLPFDDVPPIDEVPEDVKAQTERNPLDKPEHPKTESKQSSRGQLQRLLTELEKDGIDEGLLKAYLELRKAKRMGSFEGKALSLYRSDCEKAGITIKQAMETSVKRGWVGAFPEGSKNFGRGGTRKSADNWTGREKRESEREEYML